MIRLNKRYYTKEAVEATIEEFKGAAEIKAKETEKYHEITGADEETLREFANHCLAASR